MNRRVQIVAILVLLLTLALAASPDKPLSSAVAATLTPPDLNVSIQAQNTPFKVGFPGQYQVTIGNNARAVATDQPITLSVTLARGMTFSVTPAYTATGGFTCSGTGTGTVSCSSSSSLNSGATATINFYVDITGQAVGITSTTTAVVNTADEFNQADNQNQSQIVVQGSPDLILSKTHTDPMTLNQNNDFIITVQNIGTAATAQTIIVTDVLNAKLSFVSAGDSVASGNPFWNCSFNAGNSTVTCSSNNGKTLAAFGTTGDRNSIRITVKPNATGNATNTASVTDGSEEPVSATGNNTSNTDNVNIVQPPDMKLNSITPSPATFFVNGTGQTLTVQVQDIGAATVFGAPITVTTTLPNGFTFDTGVTSGGNQFTCTANGQAVSCTRNNNMAQNEVANIVIPVKVSNGALGSVNINATVTTQGDADPSNNSLVGTGISVPVKYVDLSLAKTASPTTQVVGRNITFSFAVQNVATGVNANATLGNITLTDTLPTGLTFVNGSVTGTNWTCDASAAPKIVCTYNNGGGTVAPGATTTLTFDATVGTTTAASITNTAVIDTIADLSTDPSGSNNTSTTTAITIQKPDLIVSKVPIGTFAVGQNGDYQITVTNQGTGVISTGVTLVDTVPVGFTDTLVPVAAPSGWTCNPYDVPSHSVTCTYDAATTNIAAGASAPVLTLRTKPKTQGTFQNTVAVTNTQDTNNSNNSAIATMTVNAAPPPVLSITKVHNGTFTVGANGTYTISVINTGLGPTLASPSIVVTDTLPANFNLVSVAGTNWTCTPNVATNYPPNVQISCTYTGAVVAGGANNPVGGNITVTVNPTSTLNNPYTNTATVTGGGSAQASSSDIVTVQPPSGPDLSITKTHAQNFTTTAPGTYTITIANVGSATTAGNITVQDVLPAGFTYVSANGGGVFTCPTAPASNPITCTTSSTIAVGGTASITLQAQAGTAGTSFVNTATVSGGGDVNNLNNTANDQTTVTAANAPDVAITKTHTGNFTAGQNGLYTITVSNIGTAATPVGYTTTVTDTLPAAMTFVPASSGGTGWTCSATGQVVTCTNPTPIAAGGAQSALTIAVSVASNAGPSITNTATVNAPTGDANPNNNSSSDQTTVVGIVDIGILKSHSGNFQVGVPASYSITVQNIGTATSTGTITVVDTLPAGLTPTGASGTNWVCVLDTVSNPNTVTCTRSAAFPIAGGGSSVITINVSVANGTTGTVTNTATVSGGGDTTSGNNTANDPTVISAGPQADLSITKVHNGTFVTGQNGTYTLTVQNVGTGQAAGPIVASDNLPNGLTFVGAGSSSQCSASGQQVTCTSPTSLAAGASVAFTIQVNITAAANSVISNTAQVTPPSGDPNPNNNSSTDQVTISAAPPVSQGNSSISAFPTTVNADGSTVTTITVTLRDTNGAAVSGRQVTLSSDAGSIPSGVTVLGGTTGTSNASGVVTFQATSSTPQIVNFLAQVGAPENFNITNGTRTVTFISGNGLSPTLSTASANPTSINADNSTTSTISGVIKNNLGAVVSGVTVSISGSPNTGVTVSATSVTTDVNGNYSFTVKSSTAQTTTFTITASNAVSSITLSTQPSVTFTSTSSGGSVDASKSTFVSNYTSIPADNITTATITATLRNSSNGAISGATVTVTSSPSLSGMTVTANNSGVTDSNGVATFTVRSVTQGGPITYTASANGVTISQTATISFTAPGTTPVPNGSVTSTPGGTAGTTTPGTPGTGVAGTGANGVALLSPPSNGPSIGIVIAYRLRVRTGPGLKYARIGLLKGGTRVVLLARNARGTWFMIQLENGDTGWVSSGYIRVRRLAFRHLPVVDGTTFAATGSATATPTPTKGG